jgi:AmmeMemoRadiSam system protein B
MTTFQSGPFHETGRKPAVAGRFYPAAIDALRDMVDKFIAGGNALPRAPKIIISPHAGYQFSGPVAGKAYAAIDAATRTVILLGPPHYVAVRGIAAPSAAWFETPLGRVSVDRERVRSLLDGPVACADDDAHEPEHSLEVQLPFLQRRLSSFNIVPLLVSQVDPETAAGCIFPLIDDSTLVVASSDFSHYRTQAEARLEDNRSIVAILSGNAKAHIDACGELPIRIAMALGGKMGLHAQLLDSRTSFDTSPDSGAGRVVGYASIALVPGPDSGRAGSSPAEPPEC